MRLTEMRRAKAQAAPKKGAEKPQSMSAAKGPNGLLGRWLKR